jgi:hypothetical protein
MNQHETDVYRKYRHQMKAQQKHAGLFAPEKRQRARAAVVEEFGIPYAEVKRIVALGDAESGLTHEKPKEYGPYAYAEFQRLPLSEVQVGDRFAYATDTDARVIAIDGRTFTFRGMHLGQRGQEWTMDYPEDTPSTPGRCRSW